MYMEVIKENDKVLTKIRCTKKEWGMHIPEEVKEAINKLAIDTKKNRRYISFVLEGDYLNRDKSLLNGM